MKLGLTIKKNIKMLMRSRVSTIVLVLGPLLVIMLVGLSFSSNTFSLKMGVYSESYSDLSREFISKLNEDGFSITQMETEEICINSVKEQQMHTCIIFPEDMSLDNEKTNLISFYVDQSQINLVYLVMSSLEGSFEEVTTGISKDLTDEIVSSLFLTKAGLLDSKEILTPLIDKNSLIIRTATDSSTSLGNLDLDTKGADASVSTKSIEDKLDSLLKNSGDLIDDTILLLDGFRNDGNISNYARGIIRSDLLELEDLIINAHNFSIKELGEISEKLSSSLEALSSKLNNAKDVNSAVITKINLIKENADDIKENSELLNLMIDGMVGRINNIQITNIENIVSPITTEIIPIAQSESNLSYIFPSLIVILIMFIGLLLPSTLIIMEKNSRAHFRIFTTPTKPWLHIVATYLTSLIILILQVFIILAVSQLYFKISFLSSFWMLMLSMFVIMSLFIMMGMLLGYLFNTEEMSMLASVSLATLLLLTSGIVFPIESMPSYIIEKIKYNPVVSGSEVFRKALLFTSSFDSLKESLGILIASIFIVVFFIFLVKKLDMINFKKEKVDKKILEQKFSFGDRYAKTLPEFMVSIQSLDQNKFQNLLDEDAFKNWVYHIYKNGKLAKMIAKEETKEKIIEILANELKNNKK